jgi:hypothetical protein
MGFMEPGGFNGGFASPPVTPILDRLSVSAAAAYSLRKLRLAYAGSAIRVRRSSDDTEQDIGFISGQLDTDALETFVGAGDGFVKTWYDQSGNERNFTIATTALQPKIVNSGTIYTQNGRPTIKFTTAPTYLTSTYTYSQPFTYSMVAARDSIIGGAYQSLVGGLGWSSTVGTQATNGYISMYAGSTLISETVFPSILTNITAVFNGASSALYKDGSSIATGDAGAQGVTTSLHLNGWGGEAAGEETGNYSQCEFINFGSALSSANRQLLENNQDFYYRIAPLTFYGIWGEHWFEIVPSGATYTSFQITSAVGNDTSPGFHAANYDYDINYSVTATNADALETLYVPGSWEDRDSGNVDQGTIHVPNDFVLPDASVGDTPNNPCIILNSDTQTYTCLNGTARPTAGGSIWGYKDDTNPRTHGGSGLIGGEVLQSELNSGTIPHAIAINVWGAKYLSSAETGFVSPAIKADNDYDDPEHGDYYGGNVSALVMGTRLAIPRNTTAASLGVTSATGLKVYRALVDFGAIIVDNTKFDAVAINCDADAAVTLEAVESELSAMYAALRIVS